MQTMMKWMETNSPLDLSNFRPLGTSSSHFTDWPATQEEILQPAQPVNVANASELKMTETCFRAGDMNPGTPMIRWHQTADHGFVPNERMKVIEQKYSKVKLKS